MPKISSLCAAAVAALALTLATAMPTFAFEHQRPQDNSDAGAAFAAGTLGFMAGAAGANGDDYYHTHHRSHWRHVRACEDAYGWRYDPDTDMVRGRYHRFFPCDL